MDRLGPYVIEGEIARGGMGVVLRARHPRLGRVALKVLNPVGMDVEKQRKRFLREAEAARQLDHPHLVRVLDSGEERGRLYMAQELIEGESLAERLSRDGVLRPRAAARLVATLAEAVHHAHTEGVLHRDLKPSNVLIAPDGQPRITDFGLVRRLDASLSGTQLTDEGSFLGTPGFWSPEQAVGERGRFGPETDVYGLGATLFATLTGRPPQEGQTLLQMLAAFDRPPPSPGVDPALDAIVVRALARDPAARFPSAAALASELRAWLAPSPAPPRSAGGARRATAVAAVLLGLGGGVAAWIVARGSSEPPRPEPLAAPSREPAPTPDASAGAPRPVSWLALVAEAGALDDQGDLEGARATYTRALDLAPAQADLYRARGVLAARLGDLEGARRDLDRAVRLDPTRPLAFFARAGVRDEQGDLRGALDDYGRAIDLDPQDPRAWHNRGAVYAELGDPQRALADLTRSAELGSKAAATYEAIGNHWILAGDAARALPAFLRATELEPDDAVLWLHLGRAYDRTGRPERALVALERCLSLEDRLAAAWHYQGQLQFQREAWAPAIASFGRALDLEPDQASTWFSRGAARELSGDVAGAAEDYRRALGLDPGHAQARARLEGLKTR